MSSYGGREGVGLIFLIGLAFLSATSCPALAEQELDAVADGNSISVMLGGESLLRYHYGDVPFKPYVKELRALSGLNVLLDAPHDHLHHHGLMFAVAVDGVNFWEEAPTAGRQVQAGIVTEVSHGERPGQSIAGLEERLHWVDSGGKRLLLERREIDCNRLSDSGATMLRWRSRLSVPEGVPSVALTGSHYFGLGMRFIRAMDERGTFRNADGKPGVVFRGEERLVRSDWCAYAAQADGKDVTVAMFGHPDNPRHPTTWFTMATPFAYLSATLGLHEKPLEIVEGKPMTLQYAVVLWDRAVDAKEIDGLYQQWLKSGAK